MGFEDRDYMRTERRPAFGTMPVMSVTIWLIVINVAVYVIDRLLIRAGLGYELVVPSANARIVFPPLLWWGHFSELTAIRWFQLWRFLTFQFLHANLDHLIFNMIALYFFGPMIESYLGSRRFIPFYLLCGAGGALLYLMLLAVGFQVGDVAVPLVGASAGIFGILIAAAQVAPTATALVFFVFPVPLRTLAWLFIAFAAYSVLFRGSNAGGEAGHLGGAAVGYLLIQNPRVLDRIERLFGRPRPW